MSKLNIRMSERKKEQLRNQAGKEGKSMSGAVKDLIDDYLGQTPTDKLPVEDDLAKAYQTLWTMSDGREIEVDTIESKLGDELNTPKAAVRRRIMGDLRKRGYVRVITRINAAYYFPVVELDDRRQERQEKRRRRIESKANDEMDRLGKAVIADGGSSDIEEELDP